MANRRPQHHHAGRLQDVDRVPSAIETFRGFQSLLETISNRNTAPPSTPSTEQTNNRRSRQMIPSREEETEEALRGAFPTNGAAQQRTVRESQYFHTRSILVYFLLLLFFVDLGLGL